MSKNYIPSEELKTLYHAHINSHLNYGLFLWGPMMRSSEKNQLYKLQKQCIRLITHSNYNAHCHPLFKKTQILKLDMIKLELMKFGQQIHLDLQPDSLLKLS